MAQAKQAKQAPAAQTPAAQAPAAQAPAAQAPAVPATYATLPTSQLTKSQLRFATAKHPVTLAPGLPTTPMVLNAAKPYKVRSGNNAAWWVIVQQTITANGGSATLAQMVQAGACPKFVGYAYAKCGALVPAPAAQ